MKIPANSLTRSLLIPAIAGLTVFVGLHVFFVMTWERLFVWGGVHAGWWLNSGKSVVVTLVTLFFAALAVLWFSGATWRGAVAMWVGVLVAMPVMLATVPGEHNLGPVVLLIGGALTGGAISLGALVIAALGNNYERKASGHPIWIAGCCLAVIGVLCTVGLLRGTLVPRLVETAPLWIGVVLGLRRSGLAKWVAMPFFVYWLCIMTLNRHYLRARIVNGHFSPVEIVMTLVIDLALVLGLISCVRLRTGIRAVTAVSIFFLSFALQVATGMLSWQF